MYWWVHNLTGLLGEGDNVKVRMLVEGHHGVVGLGGEWVGVLVTGSRTWEVVPCPWLLPVVLVCLSHTMVLGRYKMGSLCHTLLPQNILLGLDPKQQSQPTLYWTLWKQTPRWTLSSFEILSGMLSHSEMCHAATHNFPHDLFTVPFLFCFSPGCVHNASIPMLG